MSIIFDISGLAVAKGRGRVGMVNGHATVFTPAHTRKYENLIKHAAGEVMGDRDPIEGPVEVIIQVFLPFPKSMSKKNLKAAHDGSLFPCTRPDLDNYVKSALDGIDKIIVRDDSQVVKLHAHKLFSSKPLMRIEVREMGKVEQVDLGDVI